MKNLIMITNGFFKTPKLIMHNITCGWNGKPLYNALQKIKLTPSLKGPLLPLHVLLDPLTKTKQ